MRILLFISLLWITQAMAADFTLQSTSFDNGNQIPYLYTCKGEDRSPAFSWANAPPQTKSFVLMTEDPDAPAGIWYHWIIFNIPSKTKFIVENEIPENSVIGKNSWGKNQYNGPCPPPGKVHHYIFTLYAIDTMLDLPKDTPISVIKDQLRTHTLATTSMTGLF